MEDNEVIFFDLETTGTEIAKDRIVSISAIRASFSGGSFQVLEKKKLLINPTIPIPKGASDVHHITDEMVIGSPKFAQVAKGIFTFFTSCNIVGGYNIKRFDIPLLYEEFARCGLLWNLEDLKILDCLKIFYEKEPRTLAGAAKFYLGKSLEEIESSNLHDSENDNLLTIEVCEGQMFFYSFNNLNEIVEYCDSIFKKDKYVDFDGKIILNDDNIPVWNFGKYFGKNFPVKNDLGYCEWVLGSDFSTITKNVIKSIIA